MYTDSEKSLLIPGGYRPSLDLRTTQRAIKSLKDLFQRNLARELHLERISAPLFVEAGSGLNDNLNGVERPVGFDVPDAGTDCEIVHSLAKWKRLALREYGFRPGEGLYTDMNAIRRDETLDNLHSIYVDQWDWEKVITRETRNEATLRDAVSRIVKAIADTEVDLNRYYPAVEPLIGEEVFFVDSEELLKAYPGLSPKEREDRITAEKGTVAILRIGSPLSDGRPHDSRAPDYDDWSLNCDIFVRYPLLDRAVELSSMGIRVDEAALSLQLQAAGCPERAELPFHRELLAGRLPLTMGGGIGQSRLCMVLLGKAHIGEVQSSVWPAGMRETLKEAGIGLL